uniref:Hemolysin n=1 Tax=Strongyloides stercoralis TaxID=6248 RepID=A0A0K0EQ86_STRER
MKIDCKGQDFVLPSLNVEEKKSEYYFDKEHNKINKKSSYYLKNASKIISEYLLSDLRMYVPQNFHDTISYTDIHSTLEENYCIKSDDKLNAIGNLITVDRLAKQINNLSNGFYCPIIRNGELFFVLEDDDVKTAIDIDVKIPIKEFDA